MRAIKTITISILTVVGIAGQDPVGTKELPPEGLRGRKLVVELSGQTPHCPI